MKTLIAQLILGAALLAPASLFAQTAYSEGLINIPGSFSPQAYGIDADDQVAGFFYDGKGLYHGFVYSLGVVAQIDQPSALETAASGINSVNGVVGSYNTGTKTVGMRDGGRRYISVKGGDQKNITGINDSGMFVGWEENTRKGFVNVNGVYTYIHPAPCRGLSTPVGVYINGVNANGDFVGYCLGNNVPIPVGFARIGGVYQTVNVFGSATYPYGINDSGTIAGWYDDGSSLLHGFTLSGGTATQFDFAGTNTISTKIFALNNKGSVVGVALDHTDGIWKGFYAFVN